MFLELLSKIGAAGPPLGKIQAAGPPLGKIRVAGPALGWAWPKKKILGKVFYAKNKIIKVAPKYIQNSSTGDLEVFFQNK